MSLYTFDVLTRDRRPVSARVRLDVAGTYLEVVVLEGGAGLEVRLADNALSELAVFPVASNVVRVRAVERKEP